MSSLWLTLSVTSYSFADQVSYNKSHNEDIPPDYAITMAKYLLEKDMNFKVKTNIIQFKINYIKYQVLHWRNAKYFLKVLRNHLGKKSSHWWIGNSQSYSHILTSLKIYHCPLLVTLTREFIEGHDQLLDNIHMLENKIMRPVYV